MATIDLEWQAFSFPAATKGWVTLKREVNKSDLELACDKRAVYVVRLCRPFSLQYPKKPSPVIYIGRGNFQQRITSHISGFINPLSETLNELLIEILTCKPRARRNATAFADVEADLIAEFERRCGDTPLRNKRREKHHRTHQYEPSQLSRALDRGKGTGYHWALKPTGSNKLAAKLVK